VPIGNRPLGRLRRQASACADAKKRSARADHRPRAQSRRLWHFGSGEAAAFDENSHAHYNRLKPVERLTSALNSLLQGTTMCDTAQTLRRYRVLSATQGLFGLFWLFLALWQLTSVAIRLRDTFFNRNWAVDWIAPMGAAAFCIAWLIFSLADSAARQKHPRGYILLMVIWCIEIGLGVLLAILDSSGQVREVGILCAQFACSGGLLRRSTFHPDSLLTLREMCRKD